MTNIEKFID